MLTILMHQMRILTNHVSSVMLSNLLSILNIIPLQLLWHGTKDFTILSEGPAPTSQSVTQTSDQIFTPPLQPLRH
jgi:hypothetical protein